MRVKKPNKCSHVLLVVHKLQIDPSSLDSILGLSIKLKIHTSSKVPLVLLFSPVGQSNFQGYEHKTCQVS